MHLIIKVRQNGYLSQYAAFIREYFPDLSIELQDKIPFKELLPRADFYISFYSQTLFEASSLGIPVLYFHKDLEYLQPPFNGNSELTTAVSFEDLLQKLDLFYTQDPIYDRIRNKKVIEYYFGPLDGQNLENNLNLIYSMLGLEPRIERI